MPWWGNGPFDAFSHVFQPQAVKKYVPTSVWYHQSTNLWLRFVPSWLSLYINIGARAVAERRNVHLRQKERRREKVWLPCSQDFWSKKFLHLAWRQIDTVWYIYIYIYIRIYTYIYIWIIYDCRTIKKNCTSVAWPWENAINIRQSASKCPKNLQFCWGFGTSWHSHDVIAFWFIDLSYAWRSCGCTLPLVELQSNNSACSAERSPFEKPMPTGTTSLVRVADVSRVHTSVFFFGSWPTKIHLQHWIWFRFFP